MSDADNVFGVGDLCDRMSNRTVLPIGFGGRIPEEIYTDCFPVDEYSLNNGFDPPVETNANAIGEQAQRLASNSFAPPMKDKCTDSALYAQTIVEHSTNEFLGIESVPTMTPSWPAVIGQKSELSQPSQSPLPELQNCEYGSTPASEILDTPFNAHTPSSTFDIGKENKIVPVTTRPFGDMIKFNCEDSRKYAGIIEAPALVEILKEFRIKFTTTLLASNSQSRQKRGQTKMKALSSQASYSARIVMNGLKCEEVAVGSVLSDAGLYLQHPSSAECGDEVQYSNPHYLIRPGSNMPNIAHLSLSTDAQDAAIPEKLDEVGQSRLMHLFDLANNDVRPWHTPSPRLRSALKDHQVTALAMMTEKEAGILKTPMFPSIWELCANSGETMKYQHQVTYARESHPVPLNGGVLADEMGLGKTLSILALICSSLDMQSDSKALSSNAASSATLIITPKSTVSGWQQQIEKHIHPGNARTLVYHGSGRQRMFKDFGNYDIILTTYETMRADWKINGTLYWTAWHRLVLDEAHHIRNRSSELFKAACAVDSRFRWCLTGTPIHNSLDDFGALLSFIRVPSLTVKSMFDFWVATAFRQEKPDSLRRLQDLIKATCLRRTKKIIGKSLELPCRFERTEIIELDGSDRDLYKFFKDKTAAVAAGLAAQNVHKSKLDGTEESNIISLINVLRLICDHGRDLLPRSALAAWEARGQASVDWQSMQNWRRSSNEANADVELNVEDSLDSSHANDQDAIDADDSFKGWNNLSPEGAETSCYLQDYASVSKRCENGPSKRFRPSAKIKVLLENLRNAKSLQQDVDPEKPNKCVIFSFWTKMLDLIQEALKANGFCLQRIDGTASLKDRSRAIDQFTQDPNCTVMLASIGSAGEGIDLTAANHVHLIEPHWNPMVEAQAVNRIHRIGQSREVTITRYIVKNSVEEYMQLVQQDKLSLIGRSLGSGEASQSSIERERWEKLRTFLK
ncbi:MAG: hypothetical protein M1820_003829 [Bogoriella megaspora]|nr:MAG: hypothetical protein M1820_003829 [Bogoriella megaspora]